MSYQLWQDISFYLNEIDQQKALFGKSLITPDSIDFVKNKISLSIDQLRTSLELKLGKDHTSTILFAIVAAIDEEMQGFDYNHLKVRWAPLQKDFYAAYTSGEVFFKTIDGLLDDPSVPSMVSEVFYFVMKRGFKGKYRDSKSQLSKYIELLRQKIKVVSLDIANKRSGETAPYLKKQKMSKWSYYGLATATLVLGYLGLLIFSNMEF